MDEWLKVVILGVIQGLTEFLPVSSSGHLVLAEHAMGLKFHGIVLEVSLHGGTLLAVLVYYRKRILALFKGLCTGQAESRRYLSCLLVATIPAGVLFAVAGKKVESTFSEPETVSLLLCVTGIMLLSLLKPFPQERPIGVLRALWIGLAQAIALFPGISRSGTTIVAGRHAGLGPDEAAEFSILLGAVVIPAAMLVTILHGDTSAADNPSIAILACGVVTAAVVGYGAIMALVRLLRAERLWLFGVYCLLVGVLGMILF